MSVQKEHTIFFTSDSQNGAIQKSADGSVFSVALDQAIMIPTQADNATVEIESARIWYSTPNISAEYKNNTIRIISTVNSTLGFPNIFTITIPDGLWALNELSEYLSNTFVNLGFPSNLIKLGGQSATGKLIITFPFSGVQIDFSQSSIRNVFGFDSRLSPQLGTQADGYTETADSVAKFNAIQSYLIKSDLLSRGIALNNEGGGILILVPIGSNTQPGSLINYHTGRPLKVDASELIGHARSHVTFRLTDQEGGAVNTMGEDWSFTMVIKYQINSNNIGRAAGRHLI